MYNTIEQNTIDILNTYTDNIDKILDEYDRVSYRKIPDKKYKIKIIMYFSLILLFGILLGLDLAILVKSTDFITKMINVFLVFLIGYCFCNSTIYFAFALATKTSIYNINHNIKDIIYVGKLILKYCNNEDPEIIENLYKYIKYLDNSVSVSCLAIFSDTYPDYNYLLFHIYLNNDTKKLLLENNLIMSIVKFDSIRKNIDIVISILEIFIVSILMLNFNTFFVKLICVIICATIANTGVYMKYNSYIVNNINYFDDAKKRYNKFYNVLDFDDNKALKFLERI